MDLDSQIRLATFQWLSEQVEKYGEVLEWELLKQAFEFQNERIHLVSPQGIFKPKQLDLPLSIRTAANGPYPDRIGDLIYYKYQGSNPGSSDNIGLKKLMKLQKPLIYFFGLVKGKYLPAWPAYVIDADDSTLTFTVVVDEPLDWEHRTNIVEESNLAQKKYRTSSFKVRLHQRGFRERVLAAYRSQCAFCKLKHSELLDAAHIIPDDEELSTPTVDNGLALCKIHHTAFDRYILGVTPDFQIKVRSDILEEHDGPMLKHGLQELNDEKLYLPRSKNYWPNQEYLEWRYSRFVNK